MFFLFLLLRGYFSDIMGSHRARAAFRQNLESATLNPMQNDAQVEIRIARAQYENLLDYAADPEGLPKKIRNDRRRRERAVAFHMDDHGLSRRNPMRIETGRGVLTLSLQTGKEGRVRRVTVDMVTRNG